MILSSLKYTFNVLANVINMVAILFSIKKEEEDFVSYMGTILETNE